MSSMSNNKRCAVQGVLMRNAPNCILETLAGRILTDQENGLAAQRAHLLYARDAVREDQLGRNYIVRGTARMNDSAEQRYTLDPDFVPQRYKNAPEEQHLKNMVTKTFVNFGSVAYSITRPDGGTTTQTEPWIMTPTVMENANTASTFIAGTRGWPFPVGQATWDEMAPTCDVWVDVVTNDGDRVNGAVDTHECGVILNKVQTSRIVKVRKRCNVHLANRSTKKAWRKHKFTARTFSFCKLMSQSKKVAQLNAAMDAIIDEEAPMHIFPMIEPPAEAVARNKTLVDM